MLGAGPVTFEELIQREHNAIAAALAHASVPHIQVIAELARQQNLMAFNAIPYQVSFTGVLLACLPARLLSCSLARLLGAQHTYTILIDYTVHTLTTQTC